MSLTGNLETNALGGGGFGGLGIGGGGFGGGFGGGWGGGIAPFGLFGLAGIGDRGRDNGCNDNSGLVLLNAIGNLKDTVYNAKDSIDERIDSARDNLSNQIISTKDSLTNRVENVGDRVVAEGRNLADRVCDAEKTNLQQFYAAAIQSANLAQDIQNQASAIAIVNDRRFDDLSVQGANQTAAILARINDVENQNLRDQLFETRRRFDAKEAELHITNTNINTNAQAQQQFQIQTQRDNDLHRRLDAVFGSFNQLNRNTQDIINLGTMTASGTQATQSTNIK